MQRDAMILKFRDALLTTERMPRDAFAAYQHGLVDKLIRHAARHVPAYAGLEALARKPEITDEDWRRIPLVTRAALQAEPARFMAAAIPPFAGAVSEGSTSGSSGRPLRYVHEELHDVASAAQTDRFFGWWRLDGRKGLATFMSTYDDRQRREGVLRGEWRIGVPEGRRHIIELMIDVDGQVEWLAKAKPAYVFVRGGAHLQALAERAEATKTTLRFERVISTGTAMTPAARAAARRVFRAETADLYGASETGLIACQCPDCGLHHTCDETIRVEVLREDGSPAVEGEMGRVVITPLYAYAMPLIRYEIGDYAVRGPTHAPCGRSLGSLAAIVGRYRNVFRLRDGRVIAPYANAAGLAALFAYRQLQIVQTDYDRVELRYVADSEANVDADMVRAFVRERFDASLEATLVRVEGFDPAGGKFEETLSLIPER